MAGERNSWVERMPLAAGRPVLALACTVALLALATWGRWMLLGAMPVGSPFVTYFPTVLLVCFLFGVRFGVLAAVVAAGLGWGLFVRDPMQPSFVLQSFPAIVPFLILVSLNLGIFAWMQAINTRLRAERERSAKLAETRELLFRELQHRVSNNLQVAAGLLALQKKRVEDADAKAALDEAARRLGVIGRISRQLYEAEGESRSLRAFLEPLCADVVDAGGKAEVTLDVTGGEDMSLPSDAAIPVALIVAEAVANAIEHGFAGREQGAIEVELARDGKGIRVEIRDDGHGLPAGFEIGKASSLGLSIATMLAGQLKGRFELENSIPGTLARLTLPG